MTTLSDVKAYLGITSSDFDDLLQGILDGVVNFIEEYTGRKLSTISLVMDEYHDEPVRKYVFLEYGPVQSVALLRLDDAEISADEFYLDQDLAVITLQSDLSFRSVHVEYTAGYTSDNFPKGIDYCIKEMCQIFWQARNGRAGVGSITSPVTSVSGILQELPPRISTILDLYRIKI